MSWYVHAKEFFATSFGAFHLQFSARRIMIFCHIFICRRMLAALAGERPLWAFIILVVHHFTSPNELITVETLDFVELASCQLPVRRWLWIEVFP
jgi:hypothetical protein